MEVERKVRWKQIHVGRPHCAGYSPGVVPWVVMALTQQFVVLSVFDF